MGIREYFRAKSEQFFKQNRVDYQKLRKDLPTLTMSNNFTGYYNRFLSINDSILEKVDDFNLMYKDPIVYNALEMFVDDALTYSPVTQKRVWTSIDNKEQQEIAEELFKELNIDEKSWEDLTRLGMYGNCVIRVYFKNEDCSGGIINIEREDNMFRYIPVEINGMLVNYIDRYTEALLEPFEVIYGRINIMNDVSVIGNYYDLSVHRFSNMNTAKQRVLQNSFKYGSSLFENSRRVWRQLRLLEDNMILTRLNRSASLRIFKVKTPGMTPKSAKEMIEFYTELLTSSDRRLSIDDNLLKEANGQISFGENLMLPVEEKGDIEVFDHPGESNVNSIVDVDHFREKFYASLKIPLEFLGLSTGGSNFTIGDNSLLRKGIQYARRVKKLQFGGIKMYKDLLYYHMLSLKEEIDYGDINILMNIVSTAEDEEFKSVMSNSIQNTEKFVSLIDSVKKFLIDNSVDDKSRNYLLDYMTTRILNINDFNWKHFFKKLLDNLEEEKSKAVVGSDTAISPEDEDNVDKNKASGPEGTTESRKIRLEEIQKIKQNVIDISPKLNKLIYEQMYIKNIPCYEADKNTNYCTKALTSKNNRIKLIKESRTDLTLEKNLKEILETVTVFDINIFNLKFESTALDLSKYNAGNKTVKNNINEKNITFLEAQYDIKNIMNMISGNVNLYHIEDKYYCNYSNALKLFKNHIENKKNITFEVLEMKIKN
jgi:hypothetical protein